MGEPKRRAGLVRCWCPSLGGKQSTLLHQSVAELRFKSEGYPQGLIGSVSTVPSALRTDFTALNKSLGHDWLILPRLQRQESNYTRDLLQEAESP